jgi:hypothetical protein
MATQEYKALEHQKHDSTFFIFFSEKKERKYMESSTRHQKFFFLKENQKIKDMRSTHIITRLT